MEIAQVAATAAALIVVLVFVALKRDGKPDEQEAPPKVEKLRVIAATFLSGMDIHSLTYAQLLRDVQENRAFQQFLELRRIGTENDLHQASGEEAVRLIGELRGIYRIREDLERWGTQATALEERKKMIDRGEVDNG